MELRELIFEPFYEVQDTMKHKSGTFEFMASGSGIGLTLCRKFVEMHQGEIWVESEEGPGTTIYGKLPKRHYHNL